MLRTLDPFVAHLTRGSSLEVEDLCQKVCVVVFEHLHEFEDRGSGSFRAWVQEIARRRVKQGFQAPKREATALSRLAHHPRESTLSFVSRLTLRELEEQLGAGFAELSEIQREAILWDHEERDDAELAERWEVSVNAIRLHRSRGFKKLAARTKARRKSPLPRVVLQVVSSSSASAR